MVRIGIITDARAFANSQQELACFRKYGDLEIFIGDRAGIALNDLSFEADLVFTKTKNPVALTMIRAVEAKGIPTINPLSAILPCLHRLMGSVLLRNAGILVPDFCYSPPAKVPFMPFVVKNAIDRYDNEPVLVATRVEAEAMPPEWAYAQQYIDSEWEYKVYVIGDDLFFYRQRPTMFYPDKLATREFITPHPELAASVKKACRVLGLVFASVDFLNADGTYYLSDINATPGLRHVPNGPELAGKVLNDHLVKGLHAQKRLALHTVARVDG